MANNDDTTSTEASKTVAVQAYTRSAPTKSSSNVTRVTERVTIETHERITEFGKGKK